MSLPTKNPGSSKQNISKTKRSDTSPSQSQQSNMDGSDNDPLLPRFKLENYQQSANERPSFDATNITEIMDSNIDLGKDKLNEFFHDFLQFNDHATCIQLVKSKASTINSKANATSCSRMYFLFKLVTAIFEDKIKSLESSCYLKECLLTKLTQDKTTCNNSYSQAVKSSAAKKDTPRHTLIIKNIDPNVTDQPLSILKQHIDPIKEKIQIDGLKATKNSVFINFSNTTNLNKFKEVVNSNCKSLIAELPRKKLPKILIKHAKPRSEDNETLLKSLCDQNGLNIATTRIVSSWQNKFNKNLYNTILETSRADRTLIQKENNYLYYGYQRVTAKDIFSIQQCFNCFKYGHSKKDCQSQSVCNYCGEQNIRDDHLCIAKSDAKIRKCNNCVLHKFSNHNHSTTDRTCKVYQNIVAVVKMRTDFDYE